LHARVCVHTHKTHTKHTQTRVQPARARAGRPAGVPRWSTLTAEWRRTPGQAPPWPVRGHAAAAALAATHTHTCTCMRTARARSHGGRVVRGTSRHLQWGGEGERSVSVRLYLGSPPGPARPAGTSGPPTSAPHTAVHAGVRERKQWGQGAQLGPAQACPHPRPVSQHATHHRGKFPLGRSFHRAARGNPYGHHTCFVRAGQPAHPHAATLSVCVLDLASSTDSKRRGVACVHPPSPPT
jgi:hypothetical protein